MYRSAKLYPYNQDGFFLGNGLPIEFFPDTPILEPPFEIAIHHYNDDDTYKHRIGVTIDMDFIRLSGFEVSNNFDVPNNLQSLG
jgi:hypothetical protein